MINPKSHVITMIAEENFENLTDRQIYYCLVESKGFLCLLIFFLDNVKEGK